MLTKLTPEQEALKPVIRDKWFNIGWSTEPANRPEAERGVNLAYEAASLPHPKSYIWFGSPMSGAVAAGLLGDGLATVENVHELVDQWFAHREAGTLSEEWKQAVITWRWRRVSGQHLAGWYSYFDFFSNMTDELREIVKPMEGMMIVAQNAGWWWPFEEAVVLTERPSELHMTTEDDWSQRRMHNHSGPAIVYPDGWKRYFSNGQPVPEHVIEEPENLTVEMVDAEANAEVRRVMIEMMGAPKYLANATLLHEDIDEVGQPRRLWHRDVREDAPYVAVELVNSTLNLDGTRNTYFQRVPPETKTCVQAVSFLATGELRDDFRLTAQS